MPPPEALCPGVGVGTFLAAIPEGGFWQLLLGGSAGALVTVVLSFALKWRRGSWDSVRDVNVSLVARVTALEEAREEERQHRVRCEKALSELQGRFAALGALERVGTTSIGVVIADQDGVIREANLAASILLRSTTLVGASVSTMVPPESREAHEAGFARLKRPWYRLPHRTIVTKALRADGTTFDVEVQLRDSWMDEATGKRLVAAEFRELFAGFGG